MTPKNYGGACANGFKTACLSLTFLMASCGGGGSSSTPAPPPVSAPPPSPPPSSVLAAPPQTTRFLNKATFGATQSDIDTLTGTEVSDWIRAEFDKTSHDLPPYYFDGTRSFS